VQYSRSSLFVDPSAALQSNQLAVGDKILVALYVSLQAAASGGSHCGC